MPGEALLGLGRSAEAVDALDKANALNPGDKVVANRLETAKLRVTEEMGGELQVEQLLNGRDLCINPGDPIQQQTFQAGSQMNNFEYMIVNRASHECVVVDPAWDVQGLIKAATDQGLAIRGAIITHHHLDHCGGRAPAPFPPMMVEGIQTLLEQNPTPVQIWVNNSDYHKAQAQTSAKVSSIVRTVDDQHIQIGDQAVRYREV